MMYERIVSYVASTLWAIAPEKLEELLAVLAYRAAGHAFSAEEIQARIGGKPATAPIANTQNIAVIPIRGVLAHRMSGMSESSGGASAESIGRQIDAVAKNDQVGTILYSYDTPGGTVPGIQELAAKMWALRGQKRQIAHIDSLAASAGYWLAAQADEIVAAPSASAGSIGVFSVHANLQAALDKEGAQITVISAGKYKTETLPFGPLSDETKAFIQANVDRAYAQFTSDVARGRGVSASDVRSGYGEGRVLHADDALQAGLIDRIGTFEATIGQVTGSPAALRAESDAAVDTARARRLHLA